MFNTDELKGKWTEVKGEMKKKWGELTESDLDKTKGNFEALVGLFEQKIGMKTEDAKKSLSELADRWLKKGAGAEMNIADKANQKIDQAKDTLKKH